MTKESLPMLLRAIAGGSETKRLKHDIIFCAAADEIERLRQAHDDLLDTLKAIALGTAPGNRTLDGMIRDMGIAVSIARAAIARAEESSP